MPLNPRNPQERRHGQKWREGSQRWANAGGKIDPARYTVWRNRGQKEFFHPKTHFGYWVWRDQGLNHLDALQKELSYKNGTMRSAGPQRVDRMAMQSQPGPSNQPGPSTGDEGDAADSGDEVDAA